jgi:hypothetical protein
MNPLQKLKDSLGDDYSFHAELSLVKLKEILTSQDLSYTDTVAFMLNAGCVNIEATVFLSADGLTIGYDCCVKDRENDGDWISYDVIPEPVNLDVDDMELEMFQVLDRFIIERGVSYTQCSYETLSQPKKGAIVNE